MFQATTPLAGHWYIMSVTMSFSRGTKWYLPYVGQGFPGGSMWETWVRFLGQEDPLEKLPTPVFWPGEFHGQRSLAGYSPWGHKESDMTERLSLSLM